MNTRRESNYIEDQRLQKILWWRGFNKWSKQSNEPKVDTNWKTNKPIGQGVIPNEKWIHQWDKGGYQLKENDTNWEMNQPMGHKKVPIERMWKDPLVDQG